jgi:hypothetical protein
MKKPTHEEISQRAHKIWQDGSRSAGDARDHWYEAERQLLAGASQPQPHTPIAEHAASHPMSETQSAPLPAVRVALQKKAARAAIVPRHTGPKPVPAATGKPLWDHPHSS